MSMMILMIHDMQNGYMCKQARQIKSTSLGAVTFRGSFILPKHMPIGKTRHLCALEIGSTCKPARFRLGPSMKWGGHNAAFGPGYIWPLKYWNISLVQTLWSNPWVVRKAPVPCEFHKEVKVQRLTLSNLSFEQQPKLSHRWSTNMVTKV